MVCQFLSGRYSLAGSFPLRRPGTRPKAGWTIPQPRREGVLTASERRNATRKWVPQANGDHRHPGHACPSSLSAFSMDAASRSQTKKHLSIGLPHGRPEGRVALLYHPPHVLLPCLSCDEKDDGLPAVDDRQRQGDPGNPLFCGGTALTKRSLSSKGGASGKREAVWPSSPIPSRIRSKAGRLPGAGLRIFVSSVSYSRRRFRTHPFRRYRVYVARGWAPCPAGFL